MAEPGAIYQAGNVVINNNLKFHNMSFKVNEWARKLPQILE